MLMSLLPPNAESVLLMTKTWVQVRSYLERSDLVLLPVGAVEQHGPSCPLMTDTVIAEYLACAVGLRENVLVAPSVPVGDSLLHMDFPGTISLRPSTLLQVLKDYLASLIHHGFRRILVVNGHGDNRGIIQGALSEIGHECKNVRYNFGDFWDFPSSREIMERAFGDQNGGHADATDASIMLAIASDFVDQDRFAAEWIKVKYWVSRDLVPSLYTTSGVMNADQARASADVGRALIEAAVDGYCGLIRDLRDS